MNFKQKSDFGITYIKNLFYSFIDVWLNYNRLYMFKMYSLTSFDICIHLWNH